MSHVSRGPSQKPRVYTWAFVSSFIGAVNGTLAIDASIKALTHTTNRGSATNLFVNQIVIGQTLGLGIALSTSNKIRSNERITAMFSVAASQLGILSELLLYRDYFKPRYIIIKKHIELFTDGIVYIARGRQYPVYPGVVKVARSLGWGEPWCQQGVL